MLTTLIARPILGAFAKHRSVPSSGRLTCRSMVGIGATSQPEVDARAEAVLVYWFGPDYQTWKPNEFDGSKFMPRWFQGGAASDEEIKAKFQADVETLASGACDTWLGQHPWNSLAGHISSRQLYAPTPVNHRVKDGILVLVVRAACWYGHIRLDSIPVGPTVCAPKHTASQEAAKPVACTKQAYGRLHCCQLFETRFALDDKARDWADKLLVAPEAQKVHPMQLFFAALPFMHSESIVDQKRCVAYCNDAAAKVDANHGEGTPTAKDLRGCAGFGMAHLQIIEKWGRFPHRNAALGRESTPEEVQGLADGSIGSF